MQHTRPISPPPVPPVHHPVRSTPETERAQTDSFSDFNEEGQRVTEDNVMQPIQDNIAKLEAPTRQNLRSAIIWGEILNRKF